MSADHNTSEWSRARAIAKPRLAALITAGQGWCHDGNHPIARGEKWEVSHIIPVAAMKGAPAHEKHAQSNLTSSHTSCNRSAGGRSGAAIQAKNKKHESRYLQW